jgi:myo-inositol 2-dehydrogenase/D-chiro-inositol 1-dehydrogenase
MSDKDKKEGNFNRRDFMGAVAIASAGALLSSCGKTYPKATFLDEAPDGRPLKAGLVGCGGRGTGAAEDFLRASKNLKITAFADMFEDQLTKCRKRLAGKTEVADDHCFVGFDAFKKLIDSDIDIVLLATPPHFRAEHFAYAVEKGKHVFMEKPIAVDPVGVRSILASSEQAKSKNLCVVTGTQRRHQREYIETYNRVANGMIGKIVAGRAYWNQGQLWFKQRQDGWSDMEAMIRDWVNWCWLSGDHIVEQHVHNIDVINWFTGEFPAKAVAMGGRARRVTGDQFDFFSVDYTYPSGVHMLSMCRQIDGCANSTSEYIVGTEGYAFCNNGVNTIYDKAGKEIWKFQEADEPGKEPRNKSKMSPYRQEHIDLVTAIRSDKPINEAEHTAKSTLTAIMGRISAYTGKEVTWDEVMDSKMRLGPTEYALGPVPIKAEIPVPGTAKSV